MDSKVPHKGDAAPSDRAAIHDVNGSILILLLWVALMLALLNLTTAPVMPLCAPRMTQDQRSTVGVSDAARSRSASDPTEVEKLV